MFSALLEKDNDTLLLGEIFLLMEIVTMNCRKCGKSPQTSNIVLKRVNEKGVPGIFECTPNCNVTHISGAVAVEHALTIAMEEGAITKVLDSEIKYD